MSGPVDDSPAGVIAGPSPQSWEFDVLAAAEAGGCGLTEVAWAIFQSTGVTERFGVPDEMFKAFLGRIELLYSVENPYHCALHAAVRHRATRPADSAEYFLPSAVALPTRMSS